mgnify:CR=1 FL=1
MKQTALFWAFFRVGIFGFGGGPSMIPLVHAEVVTRHQWLTDEEFASKLTDSNYLRLRRRALENYPKHLKM